MPSFPAMSTVLIPPYQSIVVIKNSILSALEADLAGCVKAHAIAPLLNTVNQWSSQIPIMLTEVGINTSANLIFDIRKELYVQPLYSRNVFGLPPAELPPGFREFQNFIHKLIGAQKAESTPRVRIDLG